MKKSVWLSSVVALGSIALGIGAYTLSFLDYHERIHALLVTLILCLVAGIVATLVTRPTLHTVASFGVVVFGGVALCVGAYLLFGMHYHERAAVVLGSGILCLIGGITGLLLARSLRAVFGGVIAFGVIALLFGTYFLTILHYHGRAYFALGAGILCLICGCIALLALRQDANMRLL